MTQLSHTTYNKHDQGPEGCLSPDPFSVLRQGNGCGSRAGSAGRGVDILREALPTLCWAVPSAASLRLICLLLPWMLVCWPLGLI